MMAQIELTPYRGPHGPSDVVSIEILFWCIFEVFQHITHADIATVVVAVEDDKPQKKLRQQRLRNVLVPR
jgi:hypothetical protein